MDHSPLPFGTRVQVCFGRHHGRSGRVGDGHALLSDDEPLVWVHFDDGHEAADRGLIAVRFLDPLEETG